MRSLRRRLAGTAAVLGLLGTGIPQAAAAPAGATAADTAPPGSEPRNLVVGAAATQSSTYSTGAADHAADGDTNGDWGSGSVTHTKLESQPYWQADLGASKKIDKVVVWNRTDCCTTRLSNFWVLASATPIPARSLTDARNQPGVTAGDEVVSQSSDAQRWVKENPFGMFLHYNMSTYQNTQWADPNGNPADFNPTALDPNQWAQSIKDAGMKFGVLTVKHHDGFSLWDTAYSDYDIARSPYKGGKGDVVREYVNAMHAKGLNEVLSVTFSRSDGVRKV